jgi:prepilin-type N-terminal cleavage/methylation domain-containing protein/prepilin-type processing-associated H-X9-DG protein
MNRTSHRNGFTLVELLVVITIIGILIAILLPAVQVAREAARKAQCSNHLKQLALGCLGHEQAQGFFPTGGWAYWWVGDADRGFNRRQPGGWIYNILPYIEQGALHEIGAGMALADKKTAMLAAIQTPLDVLICPSRRKATLYPSTYTQTENVNQGLFAKNPISSRTDYAINGGTCTMGNIYIWNPPNDDGTTGDPSFADVPGYQWPTFLVNGVFIASYDHGINYPTSIRRMTDIEDGASNTCLLGEKYMWPDHYDDGSDGADNNPAFEAYDWDNTRWACWDGNANTYLSPREDTAGLQDTNSFGSTHPNSLNMALCDGSVRSITYTIDTTAFVHLCDRKDGVPIDASKL